MQGSRISIEFVVRIALVNLACIANVCGEVVQRDAAIDRYLRPYILAEVPKVGNSAEWENSGAGGYLIRFDLDVTGDDVSERFVATSLPQSRYREWTVLDRTVANISRPYDSLLSFMPGAVWRHFMDGKAGLACLEPPDIDSQRATPQEDWQYELSHYQFVFPEVRKSVAKIAEATASEIRPADNSALPKLEVVLLADYLKGLAVEWVLLKEWTENAHGYFSREEDAQQILSYSNFTAHDAVRMLGGVNQTHRPSPSSSSPTDSSLENQRASGQTSNGFSPPSKLLWLIGTGLLAILVVMFIRRRSGFR